MKAKFLLSLLCAFSALAPLHAEVAPNTTTWKLFSLTFTNTEDVSLGLNGDLELNNNYATISGGSALIHNGKNKEEEVVVLNAQKGINLSGSQDSYLKITLNEALQTGDVLTLENITEGSSCYVGTSETKGSGIDNNMTSTSFTFDATFNGVNTIYIFQNIKFKGLKITRTVNMKLGSFMSIADWSIGLITKMTTVNGLTYVPANDENSAVDNNGASVSECGGLSFMNRLKMGGGSSTTGRYLKFDVPANCYIRIYCAHANSTDNDRNLYAQFGEYDCAKDETHKLATLQANDKKAVTYHHKGEATTAYLYSDKGLNFFGIRIFYPYCYINGQEHELTYNIETGDLKLNKDLTFTDDMSFTSNVEFTANSARYERKMTNQWGTICLAFAVTFNKDTDPYDFYKIYKANSETISLQRYSSTTIPAGTPMVVRRNASETGISISENNANIAAEPGAGTFASGLSLVGTFTDMTIHSGDGYYIASNAFWPATKDVKVGAFRAYFKGEVTGAAAAGQLRISVVEDEETSIEQLNTNVSFDDAQIFNLQGTRQSDLRSGISLVRMPNGSVRKLIVK